MDRIAGLLDRVLRAPADAEVTSVVRAEVAELCARFVPYPSV
jgi:glycine/serine hydroxymethyltransferase